MATKIKKEAKVPAKSSSKDTANKMVKKEVLEVVDEITGAAESIGHKLVKIGNNALANVISTFWDKQKRKIKESLK